MQFQAPSILFFCSQKKQNIFHYSLFAVLNRLYLRLGCRVTRAKMFLGLKHSRPAQADITYLTWNTETWVDTSNK
jgi:hypothetical protein